MSPRERGARSSDKHAHVEAVFQALADEWRRETYLMSSVREMVNHRAYQRIIGLGEPALPLLLSEMVTSPDWWFWALESIAHHNPVPSGASFEQAVDAWVDWGRKKQYIV